MIIPALPSHLIGKGRVLPDYLASMISILVSRNLAFYEPPEQTRSVIVLWRLPEEWADILHSWVCEDIAPPYPTLMSVRRWQLVNSTLFLPSMRSEILLYLPHFLEYPSPFYGVPSQSLLAQAAHKSLKSQMGRVYGFFLVESKDEKNGRNVSNEY